MQPLVYRNTKHTIPRWVPFHEKEQRGIAYETDTHFVHMFGKDYGLWVISSGLTVTQKKNGSLRQWVQDTFGAVDIETAQYEVGRTIKGVWRPGLYYDGDILTGLEASIFDVRLAEQSLLILIQRLDEILNFVEPAQANLKMFGHKTRELLILACTEIESYWKSYLRMAGISVGNLGTKDYVKLQAPLRLEEYVVSLPRYADVESIRPFFGWSSTQPTQSIFWYDAYNKTKHDRGSYFDQATLLACLNAVAGVITLFCVRFGPFRLIHGAGALSAVFNQLFSIELKDCKPTSFYVPEIEIPADQRHDLICYESRDQAKQRVADPFVL